MVDATVDFHTVLFDAIPLPMIVLDARSRVIDFNDAASEFLGAARPEVFRPRTGDLFQCANAADALGGCGTTAACAHCGLRAAITKALDGDKVSCFHAMELIRNDEPVSMDFLVTAAPVRDGDTNLALIILQDATKQREEPAREFRLAS